MNMLLPHQHLSFSQSPFLWNPIKTLDFLPKPPARASTVIRMGGGPRTYPGGVSKWQWKRMQAKKAKQLLKARLCRERQIYEMRKRAELKAAVSELERPWEVVERAAEVAPNLFSVGADEQVKVLADRFQKPGGFDMWSEKDGPVLFESPDELPSARFFPKGVVHSVKPYRKVDGYGLLKEGYDGDGDGEGVDGKEGLVRGNDFGGDLSEMGNGVKGIEFGGGLSGNGDGRKGIEFGEDGREVVLEGVDGFEFEGGGDGECFSSSSLSYEREGVEFGGDLRVKGDDGRGVSLEGFDGFEWESDDGECSSSGVSYERNGVKGDGGLRRNGNGRRFLSDDVDSSSSVSYERNGVKGDDGLRRTDGGRIGDGGRYSHSSLGRNGENGNGRLRRNGYGRRFLSSSDGERSSRLNYRRNGVDGDGRTRRNGSGRRFFSDNVDQSSDGRLRRNRNGRRVLYDDVGNGRSSDGGLSHLNYERRVDGRIRRNGNGSTYASRGVDGADDGEHSPRSFSSGRYAASFDGRLRNKGSGSRVLSKDVDRSGHGRSRSKENGRRFLPKDVDGSNGLYSGGVGSVGKQRWGSSIRSRSRGKNTNRTSDYDSPRGKSADSEVYDMGLQQDGSYGFLQKHEQPDSTGW